MARSEHTPRSHGLLLSGALFVIAVALMAWSWRTFPFVLTPQFMLVVLGAAIAEYFAFEVAGVWVSLAYPLVMCAIVLCGPTAAGIAAVVTAVSYEDLRSKRPLRILVFNMGQLIVSSCGGGLVYVLLHARVLQGADGRILPLVPHDFPQTLYGVAGAALVYAGLNLILVTLGVSVYKGADPWTVARQLLPGILPSHVALSFVGLVMAQVLSIQIVALPLLLFPLLVARQLYRRYMDLRSAYADTMRSLVGAIEAKDPYTRGHSERVSEYASALGVAMGLEARALERLEYAALLHDVGKLAVPRMVLVKPARLDDDEMAQIREHPLRGAEMVSRIPPLRDLAETVRQHHERIDGAGYPNGITGSSMSLAARILAVADCYDAMTTTRAYRPALTREQALGELTNGADSQFDAEVVRRFMEAEVGELVGSPPAEVGPKTSSDVGGSAC